MTMTALRDAHDPTLPPRHPSRSAHHLRRLALVAGAVLLLAGPLLSAVAGPASADTKTVVVSGFDDSRADGHLSLFGSCLATTKGYLADPANFGPSGVANVTLDVSGTGMPTATPDALNGVNVFFTGWVDSTTYTPDEKTALLNYVKGGGALIGTTDALDHDMSDIFGMTLADGPGTTTGTITDASSPLADGPFGTVTTFNQFADVGHYTDIGPGQTVGTNSAGPAIVVIPPGALAAGSGPVVMVSDVDVFSDCDASVGSTGSIVNAALIKNTFAYVAGYEASLQTTTTTAAPTTTTTAPPTTAAPVAAAVNTSPAFTG